MTVTADSNDVIIVDDQDLRVAVRSMLDRLGLTYADLAEQAARRRFTSEQTRLAWMALRDLSEYA
jgi:hypothetical protein